MRKFLTAALIFILSTASTLGDNYGSWAIDDYLTVMATTHQFSTGDAYAATGDVDIWVYEDDTDTQIIDLIMASFDSITGLYEEKFQLTAAAGFEQGKSYHILIQATVDGVSGIVTHNFQIAADVTLSGTQTFNVTGDLSGSVGSVSGAVGSVAGNVDGSVASVSGAVGSVSGDVTITAASVDLILDELLSGHTTVGSLGYRLNPVRMNTAQAGVAGSITLDAGASVTSRDLSGLNEQLLLNETINPNAQVMV